MAKEFDLKKWAEITIEHWRRNLDELDVNKTGALHKPLRGIIFDNKETQ